MSEDFPPSGSSGAPLVPHKDWVGLACRPPRTYSPGQALLMQGDKSTDVFILLSGLVKVVRTDRDGRQRLLAFRGSGEILGEMAAQCGGVRLASVWAMNKCKASSVSSEEFERFVREHRRAMPLAVMAGNRLREQTEVHEGAVHERLAMALLRLVEVSGGQTSFSLTREELAQHIGVGRKAVTKGLERLGPGLVKAGKSRIAVVGPEGLRDVIAGLGDT
ncbi:Crp/Fnr family transcriptional regulator [Streptomyces leeuwenhoekii]|uniref:Crp/Fnr family transcriptional regulator n=1 Tax=Streptomyces leeuwenhoekii TaxID=1437453 RepID=UPI0036BB02C7